MRAPIDKLKDGAYRFCEEFIRLRIHRINKNVLEIETALVSETKSSAGDKHETGRAMLQLEREKLGKQLFEAEKMMARLGQIDLTRTTEKAALGSLVKTNTATYFLAISAGKFETEKEVIYCISADTPIGKLVMGKTRGESFHFNGKEQQIEQVG